jgi:hypothetical protein
MYKRDIFVDKPIVVTSTGLGPLWDIIEVNVAFIELSTVLALRTQVA